MNTYREIGIKRQLVGITITFLLLFLFLVLDSEDEVRDKYRHEQQRVERLLEDTTQVINALEYSMTALYPLQNDRYVLPHIVKLNGETCNFGGQSSQGQDYDFMFAGPAEMCNTDSDLYDKAYRRLFVAPSMAYFSKSTGHISSIYFVSKDKFIISSPKAFAESIEGDAFDRVITTRPYWVKATQPELIQRADKVAYAGDYKDYLTGQRVVTIARAIYMDGEFKGVLAIDSYLDALVRDKTSNYHLTEYQGGNSDEMLGFVFSQPIFASGEPTGLYLTVNESKSKHLVHMFEAERKPFIILTAIYLIFLVACWLRHTQSTQSRLRALAMLDPMTGMLNRRGFEYHLKSIQPQELIAIAVFDIDDFKIINDTLGHEAGDEIICSIAKRLNSSLRQADIIARFGGEEFVIAITSDSREHIQLVIERVQREISTAIRLSDSQSVPVTATGGAAVYELERTESIEQLWQDKGIRQADALLYQAKKAGKNRVIIGAGC